MRLRRPNRHLRRQRSASAKTLGLSRVVGNAARIRVASTDVLQIRRVQRVVVTSGARGLIVVSRHVLPL